MRGTRSPPRERVQPRPLQGEPLSAAARIECSPALAATLVRYIEEKAKPDAERLNGFHDAQLAGLELRLFSPAPVYPALDEVLLADSLQESLEELGPSDPFNAGRAEGPHARRGGEGGDRRHQAGRSGGAQGAGRGGAGRGRRLDRSAGRARAHRRSVRAQEPEDARRPGHERRDGGGREDRPRALRRVRPLRLPRRDVHAAAVVRAGQGLPDERHDRAAQDDAVRLVRPGERLRQQAARSSCRAATSSGARRSICRRR